MRFSDAFLPQLRDKNDIESVLAPYVNLRRAGRNLVGLCPFHGEKTPSFTVYPEDQTYHCYGCGEHGNVITFVRKIQNLSYYDAVKYLADRAGLRMPDDTFDDGMDRLRKRCLAANREAARFYYSCLLNEEGKQGLDYLLSRGLKPETIRHFGLGFAPNRWDSLKRFLNAKGYRDDELEQFNLLRKSPKGHYYDAFRNRVMFPIINLSGDVIAFGGRVMDDSKPKYLNSSDTIVYKKRRGIFALNFAKNGPEKKLILCEGYMDVISMHQYGFTNTVAGLGTALTDEQANLLSRYADEIYICYDSDEAGRKAADRAVGIFSKVNVKIKVLHIAGGKDPDEVLKNHGPERMRMILNDALNDTEFKLSEAKNAQDLSTNNGRLNYANAAAEILASLPNPVERELYTNVVAGEVGLPPDSIAAQITKIRRARQKKEERSRFDTVARNTLGVVKNEFYPVGTPRVVIAAEEQLLASLMRNPDFYRAVKSEVAAEDFVSPVNRRIFAAIADAADKTDRIDPYFFEELFSPEEMSHVSGLTERFGTLGNTLQECRDYINTMKKHTIESGQTEIGKLDNAAFLQALQNIKNNKL